LTQVRAVFSFLGPILAWPLYALVGRRWLHVCRTAGAGNIAAVTHNVWDDEAATFDEQPDHGLRDPEVRKAWAELLLPLIPPKAVVADLGCGTGSLSLLLAEAGHRVHGVDLSGRMLEEARKRLKPGERYWSRACVRPDA
jgi:ubiquinone/menaquinone biosynthesis C-methylase UbiE